MKEILETEQDEYEVDPEFNAMIERKAAARKAGFKYIIEVTPSKRENLRFSLDLEKGYGDIHGFHTSVKNVDEVLKTARTMIKSWEGYDGIVNRNGDKVTDATLFFYSTFPEITKAMILTPGQSLISKFLGLKA